MKNRIMNFSKLFRLPIVMLLMISALSNITMDHLVNTDQKVMDFSATIKVESLDADPKLMLGRNQVTFVSDGSNSLSVLIPLREGSVPFFGYQFTDVKKNDEIKVDIHSSREIYFFKNNLMAYTHRYETPVFYASSPTVDLTNSGKTQLKEVSSDYQVRPDKNQLKANTLIFILLLILCSLWLGVFARKKSDSNSNTTTTISSKTKLQFILLSFGFYMLLFLNWFLGEKDPVGAKNLTPFGPSGPLFSDFFQITQFANFTNIYDSSATNYPPFGILILRTFTFSANYGLFLVIAFFSIGVLIGKSKFGSKDGILDVLSTILCFPLLFAIARGNLDLLTCAFVILAISSFKNGKYNFAVLFLSIAVALKLWPIVFILIFLKKSFKHALLVGFISFILSISSFFFLGYQSVSLFFKVIFSALYSGNAGTSMEFQNTYSIKTLFVLFHMLINSSSPIAPDKIDFANALSFANGMFGVMGLLFLLLFIVFLFQISKELKYQFFFASSIVLLISSPSYIYRGIILIYAFQLLYTQTSSKQDYVNFRVFSVRITTIRNISWFIIFVPTSFYYFSEKAVSISSLIVPFSLLFLLFSYAHEMGGIREFRLRISDPKESVTKIFAK